MPARFPIVLSVISGAFFYLPAFLKAYEGASAEQKTLQNMLISLLISILIGGIHILFFNGLLLGWFILLSKALKKQHQEYIKSIKKLLYLIAISQPFLFIFLVVGYYHVELDPLNWTMIFISLFVIVFRLLFVFSYLYFKIGFNKITTVVSVLPFIDCWGIIYGIYYLFTN